MAAAGGHWVKAASGPYAGKMNFVPAAKSGTLTVNGGDYEGVFMGSVMAGKLPGGDWQVIYQDKNGNYHPVYNKDGTHAIYSTQQQAVNKMTNMQKLGVTKTINNGDEAMTNTIGKLSKNTKQKGLTVTEPGAKTAAKKTVQVTEPAPKNIKGETAAAQVQVKASSTAKDYSTQADFDANKGPLTVTTSYYKNKVEVEGVMVDKDYAVTYNQHTSKYHVVELEGGTTVSTHNKVGEAFTVAKTAAANNRPAPNNPNFKDSETIYGSTGQANAVFAHHFAPHAKTLTSNEFDSVSAYQDSSYGTINKGLWSTGSISHHVKNIDTAIAKSPGLPHDTVLYRKKSTGTELYAWAQNAKVGSPYKSKGFDSTSISTSGWSGNVTLRYRAPTGLKGFFMNTKGYNSSHPGEYEYLLPRNLHWNVIGKKVTGSNITIDLEYVGEF